MKKWRFPKGQDPVSVAVPHLAAVDFDQRGIDIAPQTGGVAGSTRFSYADQGPPPEPEEKQEWEAEARLFGGIVRETQMQPGSPLFETESYKQDSTATIKESLDE
jgi:hypothetical protein